MSPLANPCPNPAPHPAPHIVGYSVLEQLYAGSRTVVYRAVENSSQRPVIIKLLHPDHAGGQAGLQLRNQYAIANALKIPGIVRPYSLEPYGSSYALVMEDFGGISLRQWITQRATCSPSSAPSSSAPFQGSPLGGESAHSRPSLPHDTQTFLLDVLEIALQLADILHDLHQARVIHKDIKPANILIHPESKQVKLIDFSLSSLLPKETLEIKSATSLEGTLAYLAPEQTGRMNRGVDYRADFYALGVTLFELLTGQLPFQSDDPLELVYCHLAKLPPRADQLCADIPAVLSDIVAKLMAKNAEDRYQSAVGLRHDLQTSLTQLRATGHLEPVAIATQDACDRFLIPEKLYGREAEVRELLAAFERVAQAPLSSSPGSELVLVAGFSGIGKTAVINEVHQPIARTARNVNGPRSYFIKGKFDQFNRNIPFSAFFQALRDLVGQLLAESDAQLAQWQARILTALGENGQVIIDVVPELAAILGPQPAAVALSGNEAQHRFYRVLQHFIQVFATGGHPLVIFLDDLQWADLASLSLMDLLVRQCDALLLIGAYRDHEVSATHPLRLMVDNLSKADVAVHTLTLSPLSQTHINHLIADTLSCSENAALPLAQRVYQKAQGNPFFTTQLLKSFHTDGLIEFDREVRQWQCDMTRLTSQVLSLDVVEFMTLQLQKLPASCQTLLKLAACIGNQFDLTTLAIACEQPPTKIALDLWPALQEGFILPQNDLYKFFQEEPVASPRSPQPRYPQPRYPQPRYPLRTPVPIGSCTIAFSKRPTPSSPKTIGKPPT